MKKEHIIIPIVMLAMLIALSMPTSALNGPVAIDSLNQIVDSVPHGDYTVRWTPNPSPYTFSVPDKSLYWVGIYDSVWMPNDPIHATYNGHTLPDSNCTSLNTRWWTGCGTTGVWFDNETGNTTQGASNTYKSWNIDNAHGTGVPIVYIEPDNPNTLYYWFYQGYDDSEGYSGCDGYTYCMDYTFTGIDKDVATKWTLMVAVTCAQDGNVTFNGNPLPNGYDVNSAYYDVATNDVTGMVNDGVNTVGLRTDDMYFHPYWMWLVGRTVAGAPPVAGFTANVTTGRVPLAVHFTDTSAGEITSRKWDFDNNGEIDSTDQHPDYTYTDPGVYTVRLNVTGPDGSDEEIKVDYITVTAGNIPPVADAGSDQTAGIDETVTFNGSGSYDPDGSIVSYDWNFGDGSTGTGEITTHAYSSEGTYTVTLTVTDNDGATGNDTAVVTVSLPGGYAGNHPLTIYEHGTINGGLVYDTVTDGSKYTCLWPVPSMPEETRPVLYQNMTVNIPENATVKTARLYNTYCWSCWGGDDYAACPPAQARLTLTDTSTHETWTTGDLTHSYTPANRDECPNPINSTNCPGYPGGVVQYWDTKGRTYASTMWDMPSGEFAWDVTGLVTHSGTYNASIVDPRDRARVGDERFCTFGFGLLVVYEEPSSAKIKYEVAEGCDILMARAYETPEDATTSATFGGVSNAINANLTTVVTGSDGGTFDPPENMIYFNGIEIGPSTAGGIYHYGVNYFDITSNLNADQNVIEFQDRDDCEYVHNAFLVVELPDDVATADIPVKGTVTGSYEDTHASDNVHEAIEEVESKGKPASRYSYLEHKWTIDVTGGSDATFYVEAYRTANGEGDDFVFEYSKDDSTGSYTPMVTVTKAIDDDTYQTYTFTEPISGTAYIRVRDTDRTAENKVLDTISIDNMFIRSVSAPPSDKMHIASIDMTLKTAGPNVNAIALVTIVDANGVAVEGASVSGHWSGATSDTDSCTTDASGRVSLSSDKVKNASGKTFTFTVDTVLLTGWTYDPASNVVTSGSISV